FDMTGNITGNLSGSVGSVTGSVTLAAEQEFNNTGQTTSLPANVKAVNGEDIEVVTEFDANVTKVLGTALTETTEGRLAGNVSTFFDNGDADSSAKVGDVASASATADAVAAKFGVSGTVSDSEPAAGG